MFSRLDDSFRGHSTYLFCHVPSGLLISLLRLPKVSAPSRVAQAVDRVGVFGTPCGLHPMDAKANRAPEPNMALLGLLYI